MVGVTIHWTTLAVMRGEISEDFRVLRNKEREVEGLRERIETVRAVISFDIEMFQEGKDLIFCTKRS